MDQATNQVIAIRPAELEIGVPGFVPSVRSSASNIYISEVKAQTHDERRMSFVWRSPSSGLLLSPLAYLVFRIKVKAPYKLNRADMIGALFGHFDCTRNGQSATIDPTPIDNAAGIREGYGARPLFTFGEGNCVQQAIESLSISCNGATWTELNGNLYSRSLERCFAPSSVIQKAYSTCGGQWNEFDDKPLSGTCLGLSDLLQYHALGGGVRSLEVAEAAAGQMAMNGYRAIEGLTADTGVCRRMDNFFDQIVDAEVGTGAAAAVFPVTDNSITLEIRAPLQGGPFNSLWGASGLSRSDPRQKMALGIPNYNQGQITYNFKNLIKSIVRRLGRPGHVAAANAVEGNVTGFLEKDIEVTYDSDTVPIMYFTYIRLPPFRSYPTSSAITLYRRDVRRPESQVVGGKTFSAGLFDTGSAQVGLQCVSDLSSRPTTQVIRPPSVRDAGMRALSDADVRFNGIQFPQVPDHLFIVFEKSSDVYSLKNPTHGLATVEPKTEAVFNTKWDTGAMANMAAHGHVEAALMGANLAHDLNAAGQALNSFKAEAAGRYIAQNQSSNAAILQLAITVQSAVGSWSFRGEKDSYLQDRDLLWRKHSSNCCDDYMPAGRGRWQSRASCALLSMSDFLLGLNVSSGVVFPVIFDISVKFRNMAGVSSGFVYNSGATKGGRQVYDDFICGTPVIVGCFNSQILSIASSSAVISAQAFSASTASAALAQNG